MTVAVEEIPGWVSALFGGRTVRWAPAERRIGDYDGNDRTLEVFDAPASEQRSLLRRLRPVRSDIEQAIGGPLIVIFHTPGETERLYPEVSTAWRYRELAARMEEWTTSTRSDQRAYDPDDIASLTVGAA